MFRKVLSVIISIIIILLINHVIIKVPSEGYIYECTDFQGNLVYCVSAYTDKGGMFGTTEDGTHIALTSYKQIPKTERKDISVKEWF